MSLKAKYLCILDIALRVPPLFLFDKILKTEVFPQVHIHSFLNYDHNESHTQESLYKALPIATFKLFMCLIGAVTAFLLFVLWTNYLIHVYFYVLPMGLIFLSYWKNVSFLEEINVLSINFNEIMSIALNVGVQIFLASAYCFIKRLRSISWIEQRIVECAFLAPSFLVFFPLSLSNCKYFTSVTVMILFVMLLLDIWNYGMKIISILTSGYKHTRDFAHNFGISALVENEWQRLNVPSVLRLFWIIRTVNNTYLHILTMNDDLSRDVSKFILINGSETLVAVLGLTSIVSVLCHFIGKAFQWFLLIEDNSEDKSIGTVSAILFYILALQTGLTTLESEKRFIRLCRNFCLLVTALFHFLHNLVAPTLMSLSAARNPSNTRHIRALSASSFLLIAPVVLLVNLWRRYSSSTWLLAVTAFSIEVIIKVLVSLATYTLFVLDARRTTFWEKLDDYLYYVKAFGNSVEFCFGIFLFFNGAWILAFESGGAIRALMMCIHAYFNIWCEAKAGWSVFIKRRNAVYKISSLPEATTEQMSKYDDVCAICYQDMTTAKVTKCKHYFHGVCLRKWLYVQDRCPLCHDIIINCQEQGDLQS